MFTEAIALPPPQLWLAPVALAVALWWSGTALVLRLDGRAPGTFRSTLAIATAGALLAVVGIVLSRDAATPAGAYTAFGCALVLWGWNELAFLLGFVTGPRKHACAPGCQGLRHFGHAAATLLWHELCLLASAVGVVALVGSSANPVAAWTFLLLWGMRLSAKLNLHLGVPNVGEGLLPEHLGHLGRYLVRRPMNPLFPVSVTAATLLTAAFALRALAPGADAFQVVAASLLATLAGLALLEHWLLVLPLPVEALWAWGLRSRDAHERPPEPPLNASPES